MRFRCWKLFSYGLLLVPFMFATGCGNRHMSQEEATVVEDVPGEDVSDLDEGDTTEASERGSSDLNQ
ncbi:MAG: hypothetical protein KDB14_08000 [Planctomycetales bacterium]|nr:hypothetical protein [Planctomycetales bacterium]